MNSALRYHYQQIHTLINDQIKLSSEIDAFKKGDFATASNPILQNLVQARTTSSLIGLDDGPSQGDPSRPWIPGDTVSQPLMSLSLFGCRLPRQLPFRSHTATVHAHNKVSTTAPAIPHRRTPSPCPPSSPILAAASQSRQGRLILVR